MTQSNPDNILWLDFEATGLMSDPATVPLEGAAIITDGDLNELATFGPTALFAERDELLDMDDFVWGMHLGTGLVHRVAKSKISRKAFDLALRNFARPYFPEKGFALLDGTKYRGMVIGGNSVKFDFDVIEKFFPETRKNMDYRVIDISGVGELMRRWNRPAWEAMPPKDSDHTAMTDIRAGVNELRYYRQHGFVDREITA